MTDKLAEDIDKALLGLKTAIAKQEDAFANEESTYIGVMEDAESALHQCRDRMRWVPIGERLPNDDDGEDVLCLRERGNITVALMNDEGCWYGSMSSQLFDVTHWMPLPQPPQQDKCRGCGDEAKAMIAGLCVQCARDTYEDRDDLPHQEQQEQSG